MKVLIDNEIQSLLRPLTPDERAALRIKLMSDGCTESLPVWSPDGRLYLLLDGHHRREICIAERIRFSYREMKFPSRAMAIQWVIDNQLGRRNLTEQQVAYYRGREYLNKKQSEPGEKVLPDGQNVHPNEPAEKPPKTMALELAEKHGVNEKTIRRDAEYATAVDALPETEKQKVLSGESGKSKTQVIQEAAAPTSKKPKAGSVKFDMNAFESDWGKLYRQIDSFGNAYGCKETPQAENLRRILVDFKKAFTAWERGARKK